MCALRVHDVVDGNKPPLKIRTLGKRPTGLSTTTSSKSNSYVTADVSAVADSGAQSDLWSLTDYLAQGFPRDNLVPVALSRQPLTYSY